MAEKRRVRLIVEYDGTNYAGWQRQINAMSVQQRLEEALQSSPERIQYQTGLLYHEKRQHSTVFYEWGKKNLILADIHARPPNTGTARSQIILQCSFM